MELQFKISRTIKKKTFPHSSTGVCVCVAVTREIQTDTFGIASAEMCPCFDGNALTRRKNQSSKSKFTRDILFLSVAASRNVTVTRFPFRCFHVNHITENIVVFFCVLFFVFKFYLIEQSARVLIRVRLRRIVIWICECSV